MTAAPAPWALGPCAPDPIDAGELARLIAAGWAREGDAIVRTYRFADFTAAWAFMSRAALVAERQDHHPDWRNVWNRVELRLTTHRPKGLTARDARLAFALDAIAEG
ncbi:MAG: 4a-hydroxytetrahydrobiopterin dehydratase [Paracoccaceae bacterium]